MTSIRMNPTKKFFELVPNDSVQFGNRFHNISAKNVIFFSCVDFQFDLSVKVDKHITEINYKYLLDKNPELQEKNCLRNVCKL